MRGPWDAAFYEPFPVILDSLGQPKRRFKRRSNRYCIRFPEGLLKKKEEAEGGLDGVQVSRGRGENRPDLFSSFPWKTHHPCVSCLEAFSSPSKSKMDWSPQQQTPEKRGEADQRTKETDGGRGKMKGGGQGAAIWRKKQTLSCLFSGDEFPPSYSIYRSDVLYVPLFTPGEKRHVYHQIRADIFTTAYITDWHVKCPSNHLKISYSIILMTIISAATWPAYANCVRDNLLYLST